MYSIYRTKHNDEVVEGYCSKGILEGDFSIYFKVNDHLIYKYDYSLTKNELNFQESELNNTENYEQNKKICDEGNATIYQNLVCSMQKKVLLNEYDNVKHLSEIEYYKDENTAVDISKLK